MKDMRYSFRDELAILTTMILVSLTVGSGPEVYPPLRKEIASELSEAARRVQAYEEN